MFESLLPIIVSTNYQIIKESHQVTKGVLN